MSKKRYNKAALSYPQLIQQLKDRGLTIHNEEKALHLLKNISYYRLSGYWYPLLVDKENHQFKEGSTFDTAFKLYCFDRELRLLVLREIEKIEVAVRSQMNHLLALYKGVHWFRDTTLFRDHDKLNASLEKLRTDFDRSDEQFIQTFKEKYSDEFPHAG
jgi:abortive infection bacteriophage resistance protein